MFILLKVLRKLLYDASADLYAPYAGTGNIKLFDEMKLTDEESTNISIMAVEIADIIESDSVAFMTVQKHRFRVGQLQRFH